MLLALTDEPAGTVFGERDSAGDRHRTNDATLLWKKCEEIQLLTT